MSFSFISPIYGTKAVDVIDYEMFHFISHIVIFQQTKGDQYALYLNNY